MPLCSLASPLALQNGKLVKLSSFRQQTVGPFSFGGKPVVLFFYPADNTPGCTKQACAFRDSYSEFAAAGAVVLGISADSVESHAGFQEAQSLPFDLLVDDADEVRTAYGIPKDLGLLKGRQTYVIDKNGEVVLSFNSQFAFEDHAKKALAVL